MIRSTLPLAAGAVAVLLAPAPLTAQRVVATAYGVAATNAEVDRTRQARGLGFGAEVGVEFGRLRLEGRGQTAELQADFSLQPDYALHELALLASYRWRPYLALQLGAGRRFMSPDFAAQEVGVLRVGVLTETQLTRLGRVWGRAAYLPVTRFSGGGGSSLGLELGLGVSLGPSDGRFQGLVDFTFQRIDREVKGGAAPIRYSVARAGMNARLRGRDELRDR